MAALDLARTWEKLHYWPGMKFNATKTEEALSSCKREKPVHPVLKLGEDVISPKLEHKHLGLILDSKLNFKSHIREAILKAQRGIAFLKYLSKFVSREVLDQTCKLYVRAHLDYGDIVYHRHDPEMHLSFTEQLEQVQYNAPLVVTGVWKGTSRLKLFYELGWDTLYDRRPYRKLGHFFSLSKSKTSDYHLQETLEQRVTEYDYRSTRNFEQDISSTSGALTHILITHFMNGINQIEQFKSLLLLLYLRKTCCRSLGL